MGICILLLSPSFPCDHFHIRSVKAVQRVATMETEHLKHKD